MDQTFTLQLIYACLIACSLSFIAGGLLVGICCAYVLKKRDWSWHELGGAMAGVLDAQKRIHTETHEKYLSIVNDLSERVMEDNAGERRHTERLERMILRFESWLGAQTEGGAIPVSHEPEEPATIRLRTQRMAAAQHEAVSGQDRDVQDMQRDHLP